MAQYLIFYMANRWTAKILIAALIVRSLLKLSPTQNSMPSRPLRRLKGGQGGGIRDIP